MKKATLPGSSFVRAYKPVKYLIRECRNIVFPGSGNYWERRYRKNGNSGIGSYGAMAVYKAAIVNKFVEEKNINKVIELGCGDGNQLKQFHFPEYIGLDVSITAINLCKDIFKQDTTKQFFHYEGKIRVDNLLFFQAELSLSLDVIYHLVEDEVYEEYMYQLFTFSSRFVIIYAWDLEEGRKYHVRHRNFSKWIRENIPGFQLKERITEAPFCDFFIYEKITNQL